MSPGRRANEREPLPVDGRDFCSFSSDDRNGTLRAERFDAALSLLLLAVSASDDELGGSGGGLARSRAVGSGGTCGLFRFGVNFGDIGSEDDDAVDVVDDGGGDETGNIAANRALVAF